MTSIPAATNTIQQRRVLKVLERIIGQVSVDHGMAEAYADAFEPALDEMLGQDAFGTEGQSDPRGDQRDNVWSMTNVQGVDE